MESAHAENHARAAAGAGEQLHRLERAPSDVASEWRTKLGEEELDDDRTGERRDVCQAADGAPAAAVLTGQGNTLRTEPWTH